MNDKIPISSTCTVTHREAQLALFQHFVEAYLDERTGDLRAFSVSHYTPIMVKAILGLAFEEHGVWITEEYMGEGGYTAAHYVAGELIDELFPSEDR